MRVEEKPNPVLLSIVDNGIGLSGIEQRRIFQHFSAWVNHVQDQVAAVVLAKNHCELPV